MLAHTQYTLSGKMENGSINHFQYQSRENPCP